MTTAPQGKKRLHPGWLLAAFFGVLIATEIAFYAVAFTLPSDAIVDTPASGHASGLDAEGAGPHR